MKISTYAQLEEQARNWQGSQLTRPDGSQLSYAFWQTTQPKGHVLIAPGRNEVYLKYTEVAAEWAERGYQVLSYNPLTEIRDFSQHLADFRQLTTDIWQPHVGGQFALVQGHSTGAHTAIRCLAKNATGVNGLIVSAPLIGINYRTRGVPDFAAAQVTAFMGRTRPEEYAWGQKPYTRAGTPFEDNRWTSDAERYGWMQDMFDHHPEFAPHGAKWGWIFAAQRSCRLLRRELSGLKLPTLLLSTPNDRAVSGPAQALLTHATNVALPHSRHEVFMERDEIRNQAWSAIDTFISRLRQTTRPSL